MAERRTRPRADAPSRDGQQRGQSRSAASQDGQAPRSGRSPRPTVIEVARRAAGELAELLGREPEGVVSLERTDDGWCVGVEVVELRRIPDSADVIAQYAVDVDERGDLVGYHRVARYTRGRTQDES